MRLANCDWTESSLNPSKSIQGFYSIQSFHYYFNLYKCYVAIDTYLFNKNRLYEPFLIIRWFIKSLFRFLCQFSYDKKPTKCRFIKTALSGQKLIRLYKNQEDTDAVSLGNEKRRMNVAPPTRMKTELRSSWGSHRKESHRSFFKEVSWEHLALCWCS